MKVNILNNHEVVLVDVPEGSEILSVGGYYSKADDVVSYRNIYDNLPVGVEWKQLGFGTASQVSEEEAKGIVHRQKGRFEHLYKNYGKVNGPNYYTTALESLHSYIRANGHQPETCVIVIRKKN